MTVQAPLRTFHGRDRRIGERHRIAEQIEVTLPSSGRFRRGRKPIMMSTDDLSLSGAGFTSDTIPDLQVLLPVTVKVGDVVGAAVVRKVVPHGATMTSYGIEFMDPRLGDAADAVIEQKVGRPAAIPKQARSPLTSSSPYWSDLSNWS